MGSLLGGVTQALTPQNQFNATAPGVISQQQQLAQALAAQAAGTGPNPAQSQFQQNTNQAIQQSAGLVASQKGINPALATRLAGQQAAGMSQQAAGQAATLNAQQQLGAQGQEAGVLGTIGQEQLAPQAINAAAAAQNASANQKTAGGLLGGIAAAFADGGTIGYDDGGTVDPSTQIANSLMQQAGVANYGAGNTNVGQSFAQIGNAVGSQIAGNSFMNAASGSQEEDKALDKFLSYSDGGEIPPHVKDMAEVYHAKMNLGGTAKALLSPKERVVEPKDKMAVASGKKSVFEAGKPVPGKPKVSGDSEKNDVVPANPKVGSVVIPKSIMESKDPVKGSADFVAEQLRKHGKGSSKGSPEEFKAALKNAISSRKMAS